MKFDRVHLRYAPGLHEGLEEVEFGEGLTFVVGPNASGKSTLARTMRLALWPQSTPPSIDASVRVLSGRGDQRATEIRSGKALTPLAEAPADSSVAQLYRLGLAELLKTGNAADEAFAQKLQTELHGGIPVSSIREDIVSGRTKHTGPKSNLKKAQKKLREAKATNRALLDDEEKLTRLTRQREEAKHAQELAEATKLLVQALDRHDELNSINETLDGFDDALEHVRVDDLNTRRSVEQNLSNARSLRDQKKAELQRLEDRLSEIDSAWRELVPEAINDGASIREDLQSQRQTVADWEDSVQVNKQKLVDVEQQLFAGPASKPISADTRDRLKETYDELRRAQAEVEGLTNAEEYFASLSAEHGSEEELQQRIFALREWLRTAENPAAGKSNLPLVALLSALATSIALGVAVAPDIAALSLSLAVATVLAAITFVVLLLFWWKARSGTQDEWDTTRDTVRRKAERVGVSLTTWDEQRVEEKLRSIEAELLTVREATQVSQRHKEVARRKHEAEQRRKDAQSAVDTALADAGLKSGLMELEAAELFYRTQSWVEAEQAHSEAKAELAVADKRLQETKQEWSQWLLRHGLRHHTEQHGEGAIIELARNKLDIVKTLRRDIDEAQSALRREEEAVETALHEHQRLKERLGSLLESEAELKHAIEENKQRQDLLTQQSAARRQLERSLDQLEQVADILRKEGLLDERPMAAERLVDVSRKTVEQTHGQAREQARQLDTLIEECSRLEERLDTAKEGHQLEDAYAALDRARAESADQAERRGMLMLEEVLLDWSAQGTADEGGSKSLAYADEWLGRFTHGAFGLRLSVDGELVGFDVEAQEERGLSQLSDATRVQALLAGRLAAIRDAESGREELPLILDEVFSTTDPERFEAVAHALSELVKSGRQVVYLTADPGEWTRWQILSQRANLSQPHVVWLEEATQDHATGVGIPEQKKISRPGDMSAAEYAEQLSIGSPTMHTPVSQWPILWLLPDDLHAIHAALLRNISSTAQALGFASSAGDTAVWGADRDDARELTNRLQRRRDMLAAAQHRWQRGANRPFRWEDVEDSGAVSENFAEEAYALFEEHADDPATFVDEVGNLSRFRSSNLEQLREHFAEQGILAELEPATAAELREVAVRAVDSSQCDQSDLAWLNGLIAQVVK